MRQQKPAIALCLLLCLCYGSVKGQFTLSGEYRPRTEMSQGYKKLAKDGQLPSLFTSQRTRLILQHETPLFKTSLVLQDVRLFGSQPQLVANQDFGVSVHQAWAEILFPKNISLKVGRQELVYDNARILGNVDWVQQARSHDLALLKYQGKFKAHLGLAYHESGQITNNFYLGPDAYKSMQFLWLNHKIKTLSVSILALNNGVPFFNSADTAGNLKDQRIRYSQTIGTHLAMPLGKVNLVGYFYLQAGTGGDGKQISGAYNLGIEGWYQLNRKTRISLGYEYLTGRDQINPAKDNTAFTPLYGTNHAFNGWMDYFYVGNHMNSVGLSNPYLKVDYTRGLWSFAAHAHYFMSAANIEDPDNPGKAMSSSLGTEADLMVRYTLNHQASLTLGYSRMFGTPSMAVIRGGNPDAVSHWGWFQILVKPTFLQQ